MGLVSKTLFFVSVCGVLFFTAACHKKNDQRIAKDSAHAASPAQATTLETKLDQNAVNVATAIKVLSQADNIFNQVWPYVWEEGVSKVNNIFGVSRLYLKMRFTDDGRAFERNEHRGTDVQIKITKTTPGSLGKPVAIGYAMFVKSGQMQEPLHLMTWEHDLSGNIKFEFETSNFPQGTGLSLKTLGRKAVCQFKAQADDHRLDLMKCVGVGQNKNSSEYVEFSSLEFSRDAKLMVKVTGQRFANLQSLDRKIDLMVPLNGDIQITEVFPAKEKPAVVAEAIPQTPPIKAHNEPQEAPAVGKPGTPPAPMSAAQQAQGQKPGAKKAPAQPAFDDSNLTPEQIDLLKQGFPIEEVRKMQPEEGEEEVVYDEYGNPIPQEQVEDEQIEQDPSAQPQQANNPAVL